MLALNSIDWLICLILKYDVDFQPLGPQSRFMCFDVIDVFMYLYLNNLFLTPTKYPSTIVI